MYSKLSNTYSIKTYRLGEFPKEGGGIIIGDGGKLGVVRQPTTTNPPTITSEGCDVWLAGAGGDDAVKPGVNGYKIDGGSYLKCGSGAKHDTFTCNSAGSSDPFPCCETEISGYPNIILRNETNTPPTISCSNKTLTSTWQCSGDPRLEVY